MGLAEGIAVVASALPGISIGALQAGAVQAEVANFANGVLGTVALKYVAAGGEITKGVFVWYGLDPNTGAPAWNTFTFPINPEELTESWSPDYAAIKIPGQNDAQYQFVHGGEKPLAFTLNFFYSPAKVGFISGQVQLLKQLVTRLPVAQDTTTAMPAPPAVFLYFGKHIQGKRYIVTKMEAKYKDLFDPAFLLPMFAQVSFELKLAPAPVASPDSLVRGAAHGKLSTVLQSAF